LGVHVNRDEIGYCYNVSDPATAGKSYK